MTPPTRILESCLYANDLAAARDFYTGVLGLTLHGETAGRHVFLHCGENMVLLFNPTATKLPHADGIPSHGCHGHGHLTWAVTPTELDTWATHLVNAGIEIEHDQRWPNGARSIYFRDPAGNSLEFATPNLWRNGE